MSSKSQRAMKAGLGGGLPATNKGAVGLTSLRKPPVSPGRGSLRLIPGPGHHPAPPSEPPCPAVRRWKSSCKMSPPRRQQVTI